MEYYLQAPNASNEYYLQALLDKNVYISCINISKCIGHPQIFNTMFNYIDKNDIIYYTTILDRTIETNNIDIFIQIFDYIKQNNLAFYNSPELINQFNNKLMLKSIENRNIQIIDLLIQNNTQWKTINNIPSIYAVYKMSYYNMLVFNYFYSLYEKLSKDELNQIPSINTFQIKLPDFANNDIIIDNLNFIQILEKIFKLPIEFDSMHSLITTNILNALNVHNIWRNVINSNNYTILNIYYILKNNKINTNPLTQLNETFSNQKELFISYIDKYAYTTKNKNHEVLNISMKEYIKKVIYVLDHFNWKLPEQLSKIFDEVLTINESKEDFPIYKNKYIGELEELLNGPVKKLKAIKPKKQKNIIV